MMDQLRELAEAEPVQALCDQYALRQILSREPEDRHRLHRSREPQVRFGPSELPVPASKLHVGLFGDPECGRNRRNYLALTAGCY
jgi:hypothetical protein